MTIVLRSTRARVRVNVRAEDARAALRTASCARAAHRQRRRRRTLIVTATAAAATAVATAGAAFRCSDDVYKRQVPRARAPLQTRFANVAAARALAMRTMWPTIALVALLPLVVVEAVGSRV